MTEILSYVDDGERVRVYTDGIRRNEFVYESGRFSSMSALLAEIEKSIASEEARRERKVLKSSALVSELKVAGVLEVKGVDPVVEESLGPN